MNHHAMDKCIHLAYTDGFASGIAWAKAHPPEPPPKKDPLEEALKRVGDGDNIDDVISELLGDPARSRRPRRRKVRS